jgi:hypothetical protein
MTVRKPFTGELNKHLPRPQFSFSLMTVMGKSTPEAVAARQEKLLSRLSHGLILLHKHYSIDSNDPSCDWMLALALAQDFVPAFQVEPDKPRKGRPRLWTDGRVAALLIQMDFEMRKRKHGAKDAAEQLAKREPWKQLLEKSESTTNPAEVLRTRHAKPTEVAKRIAAIWIARMKNNPDARLESVVTHLVGLIEA